MGFSRVSTVAHIFIERETYQTASVAVPLLPSSYTSSRLAWNGSRAWLNPNSLEPVQGEFHGALQFFDNVERSLNNILCAIVGTGLQ